MRVAPSFQQLKLTIVSADLGYQGSVVRKYMPKRVEFLRTVAFPTDIAPIFPHKGLKRRVPWEQRVIGQTAKTAVVEDHPHVRSLRAILKEMDDQYERQREDLIATLPNSHVKDRALAI